MDESYSVTVNGIRHLLVDLDGTLLGNRSVPLGIDFAHRAIGILRSRGGWRKAVGTLLAIEREFRRPSPDFTNDRRVVDLVSRQMKISAEESRKLLKEGVGAIFPNLKRHFFPIEGAKEFLDWAKDHYSLTLATNPVWPREIVELRLEWAGIDPKIFGYLTDVTRMKACKPEAQYFNEILEKRGFTAQESLLIGDNTKMDLPATQTGIRVFIVGPYRDVEPFKLREGRAKAWRGPYPSLRGMLESS